jgi:molybdopterin-guanine dinucleotide biosynthesis protein
MKRATRITPLGLLGDSAGNRLNLSHFRLPQQALPEQRPLFLAVAGTSMNAGKTTACANLVKGLVRRRFRVGAAKITGTGAGVDYRNLVDAGADPTLDFVDAGYVSTYRTSVDQLRDILLTLGGALANSPLDAVVIEVADGLLQRETSQIFMMEEFTNLLDGVLFAANDALGAQAGVAWLTQRGLPVLGVTGVLTSSPLAIREAEQATGLPVYPTRDLARSVVASMMVACLKQRRNVENGLDEEDVDPPGGDGLHSSVVG